MKNIKGIINKYNCNWVDILLKELLYKKDLKAYNRVKCVIYYFPSILNSVSMEEFKGAIKFANETYICLSKEDTRLPIFDKLYNALHEGADFEPYEWGEARYITMEQMFNFFKI